MRRDLDGLAIVCVQRDLAGCRIDGLDSAHQIRAGRLLRRGCPYGKANQRRAAKRGNFHYGRNSNYLRRCQGVQGYAVGRQFCFTGRKLS